MFGATGKGFHITFDNGWTVSVQFGTGNYCDNRNYNVMSYNDMSPKECANAEIAAWPSGLGKWHVFSVYKDDETGEVYGEETVKGWVKANEVLAFMNEIANKPKHQDKEACDNPECWCKD